eukprot:5235629-Heterocapsa_arctica.AAC.1
MRAAYKEAGAPMLLLPRKPSLRCAGSTLGTGNPLRCAQPSSRAAWPFPIPESRPRWALTS